MVICPVLLWNPIHLSHRGRGFPVKTITKTRDPNHTGVFREPVLPRPGSVSIYPGMGIGSFIFEKPGMLPGIEPALPGRFLPGFENRLLPDRWTRFAFENIAVFFITAG